MELFGTAGIRGPVADVVTPALALAVGQAAGADGEAFVVGRDGRETGATLAGAVTAGLTSTGAAVERVGQVPTPALAYASRGRRGVMITASHNPPPDNGLKLFVDGEEYDRAAERRVADRVDDPPTADWDAWESSHRGSVLADYRRAVHDYARAVAGDAVDLRVAVDCGTGVAGLATPQVLTDLGATVQALNANVDGHSPARPSKPTAETLTDLRGVVAGGADIGIGHDGDADRVVLVDGDGEVVHEDTVLAVLAEHHTRASSAGDPVVVTTPNASGRVDERVRAAGGRVERVRLGGLHEGIAAARADGGPDTTVVFAGEPWKHLHPGLGGWLDGVASAAVLAGLIATEGLATLRGPVTERPYRKESVPCPDDRKPATMARLRSALPERFPDATVDTDHGVRLDLSDGGWTLVRPSGTEPYVRVYAEREDVDALIERVTEAVETAVQRIDE